MQYPKVNRIQFTELVFIAHLLDTHKNYGKYVCEG